LLLGLLSSLVGYWRKLLTANQDLPFREFANGRSLTGMGLSSIADRYSVLFCDVWGVINDGRKLVASALDALVAYRETGGVVVLITNSPRPSHSVLDHLEDFGMPPSACDGIVTSGDVAMELLKQNASKPMYYVGPEEERELFADLDIKWCEPDEAGLVVVTGFFDDVEFPGRAYQDLLEDLSRRNLPMICANPDIVARQGNILVYCAGSLAQDYEELGGQVIYVGKPYEQIYKIARQRASMLMGGAEEKCNSILAIGDSIPTDATGAKTQGIDFLFIIDGIHARNFGELHEPDLQKVHNKLETAQIKPVLVSPYLRW